MIREKKEKKKKEQEEKEEKSYARLIRDVMREKLIMNVKGTGKFVRKTLLWGLSGTTFREIIGHVLSLMTSCLTE